MATFRYKYNGGGHCFNTVFNGYLVIRIHATCNIFLVIFMHVESRNIILRETLHALLCEICYPWQRIIASTSYSKLNCVCNECEYLQLSYANLLILKSKHYLISSTVWMELSCPVPPINSYSSLPLVCSLEFVRR